MRFPKLMINGCNIAPFLKFVTDIGAKFAILDTGCDDGISVFALDALSQGETVAKCAKINPK
jgi:hypothetical protein